MTSVQTLIDFISLKLLRRIAIRYRLLTAFLLLSVLPLIASGLLSYQQSSSAIQEKTRIYFVEIVRQVSSNIKLQMDQVETTSEELILSNRFQNVLQQYYGTNEIGRIRARSEITGMLLEKYGAYAFINQKYLLDDQFRVMDSQVFSALGKSVITLARMPAVPEYASWHSYRVSAGQISVAMIRKIGARANGQPIGTLFIGVKPSYFSEIFDAVDLGPDASTYVLDSVDASIVVAGSHSGRGTIDTGTRQVLARQIRQATPGSSKTNFLTFEGAQQRRYVAAYSQVSSSTWYVVNMIPLESLDADARSLRNRILLIGVVCLLFGLVCSFIIARSISVPLDSLVSAMQQTEAGDYRSHLRPGGHDEITTLTKQFDRMAGKVNEHRDKLEERVAARTHELEKAKQSLEVLSTTDGLTGIPNRRHFDQTFEEELSRAMRMQVGLTLMMFDVDFFKNYNDFYGHQAGDDCLRTVAQFLHTRCRRATDLAARYGGEEFVFITTDTDDASGLKLAETICAELQTLALPHARSPFGCLTVSIGVASLVPAIGMSSAAFLRMADVAMYEAKNGGRNRVCSATSVA